MSNIGDVKAIFDRQGFFGPFRLYDPQEAKDILKEIRAKNNDKSKGLYGENPVNYDRHFDMPELARHIAHPEIVKRLNMVLGDDILCWRTEWFPKFPGASGTEWHAVRDYSYASGLAQITPTEETQDSFFDLTAWTTFTPSTKENGCMKFIPGTHKRALFDERKSATTGRTLGYNSMGDTTQFFGYKFAEFKIDPNWDPDSEEVVSLEMQPGECVIFTARCVHGSHPNTTQHKTRFAITTRYVPTHVRVYADQESFMAHGHRHELKDYGVVLVSGQDRCGHNRIRHFNNEGTMFPRYGTPVDLSKVSAAEVLQQVERIWRNVLKLDTVSPQDDFFDDLGGHSLLVMLTIGELAQTFGMEIPVEALFRNSTMTSLTAYICNRLSTMSAGPAPSTPPEGATERMASQPATSAV